MTTIDQAAWPPNQAVAETDWSVQDIASGDLVFSSKSDNEDLIQRVNQWSGHRWRHVASVLERDGVLHVVEIDKNSFGFRPLADFIASFDRCGVARLGLDPSCTNRATAWMEAKIETEHIYAWDDLFLAGLLALTTHGVHVGQGPRVRAALDAALAAAKQGQQSGAVDSFTCSGFIQVAYDQAGAGCSIVHDRWRRAGSWPPRLESLDDLLRDDLDPGERRRLDDLYGDASLLELFELASAVDRGQGDWRPDRGQVWETVRVLVTALAGGAFAPTPDRLETDGRWVTPTDLWQSPSVSVRGPLVRPTG